jgi:hypothetical protein
MNELSQVRAGLPRQRLAFVLAMGREGMDERTARLILRHSATVQRLAVDACNRELTPRETQRALQARDRIAALIGRTECQRVAARAVEMGWLVASPGFAVVFNGDPRGACVKIKVPSGRTDDWGGVGICVPTRGF